MSEKVRLRHRLSRAMLGLSIVGAFVALSASASQATVNVSVISAADANGFDTCSAPASSTLDDWYSPSPYHWVGIYIGGADRSCSQPNLSATWISHNANTGWGFAPIWVGKEDGVGNSCGTRSYPDYISTTGTTARSQGVSAADAAISAAQSLGFESPDILWLDVENFSYTDTSCANITQAYVDGWDRELAAQNWLSGVYGSSCASDIDYYWSASNVPFAIWGADSTTGKSVTNLTCVSSSHWAGGGILGGQRLKQFTGGHDESYGGDQLNIDSDCAVGPIDTNKSSMDYTNDNCD